MSDEHTYSARLCAACHPHPEHGGGCTIPAGAVVTTPDTSAEVERIRASDLVAAQFGLTAHLTRERWGCDPETSGDGALGTLTALATGECADLFPTDVLAIRRVMADYEIARAHRDRLAERLDEVAAERDALVDDRDEWQRVARAMECRRNGAEAERDALAARLPSPESVTRARLVAAEIVETHVAAARLTGNGLAAPRLIANDAADHIRDRARQQSGVHDQGGDVDADTLRRLAEDVDGCATLGQMDELVSEWREVRT